MTVELSTNLSSSAIYRSGYAII